MSNKKILEQLKALANPIRLDILNHLLDCEKCVCKIFEKLDLPQNLVSHHLAILKKSKFIISRKDGKNIYYSLNNEKFSDLQNFLEKFKNNNSK